MPKMPNSPELPESPVTISMNEDEIEDGITSLLEDFLLAKYGKLIKVLSWGIEAGENFSAEIE